MTYLVRKDNNFFIDYLIIRSLNIDIINSLSLDQDQQVTLQQYMLPEPFLNRYWFLGLSRVDNSQQQQMLRIFPVLQK